MEEIIELFKKDKFANSCGIQIEEFHPGYAKCSMEVTEDHLNGIGTLMGGALFTLADFTFSVAANSYGTIGVSLNAFITYLRKCTGGKVTAIATEVSRGNRTGTYRVCVNDEDGNQIAEVTGTCYFKKAPVK
ncbi:MAG: PaaI family thioesterase [Bacteroidota bacterium]|nr:PaaI family thioesterase [Bacteroidota bacterium]